MLKYCDPSGKPGCHCARAGGRPTPAPARRARSPCAPNCFPQARDAPCGHID